MWKWMLAIIVIGLVSESVYADAILPQVKIPQNGFSDLVKILGRLQGRVLATLIEKGMPDEEVVRLLGNGDKPLASLSLTGACLFGTRDYFWTYGFTVLLVGDKAGVLRVQSVTFRPLLD